MSNTTARAYPRSVPFNPPPKPVRRKSRLWLWTFMSILGVIAVEALTAFLMYKDLLPFKGIRHAEAAASATPVAVQPVTLTTLTQQPSAANTPDDRLLSALGGLSAAHLYQTYLNIGMLADGVEGEVYTAEEGLKLLDTVTAMIATVDAQLARLRSANLKAEDQQALDRLANWWHCCKCKPASCVPTGRPARRTTPRNSSRAARRPGRGSRICWGSRNEGAVLTPGRIFSGATVRF